MLHSTNLARQLFTSHITTIDMNSESIVQAINLFETFKRDKIIISGNFYDNIWKISNEYEHLHFDFNVEFFTYKRFYEPIFGIDSNVFINYLKTFILIHFGSLQLRTLQNMIRDIKHVIEQDPNEINDLNEKARIYNPLYIKEFFNLLPMPLNEEKYSLFVEALDDVKIGFAFTEARTQRTLASFDSYMSFNDIMNDYWNSDIDDDERLFFYPLYLWWQITGVYPQRPREFLLIPRDCLRPKRDGYHLIMRKNLIKGSETEKTYKIPTDYTEVEGIITEELANEILKYQELTKKYPANELDTLLVSNTHYQRWGITNRPSSRYFTYTNLRTVLGYFYSEIIFKRYRMQFQPDLDVIYLKANEIQMIHLGDTRHFSLINIIAEGGTPFIAMELAGHRSVDMASHYYSNITKFIECRTYRQYKKVLRGNVEYTPSKNEDLPPTARRYVKLPDGNLCYSANYMNSIFIDCEKVISEDGEIGKCSSDCRYYRKASDENFLSDDSGYKNKLKMDCEHLEKVVKAVRDMYGNQEDLIQAFLRIKSSSYEYEQFLKEKMAEKLRNTKNQ